MKLTECFSWKWRFHRLFIIQPETERLPRLRGEEDTRLRGEEVDCINTTNL